MSESREAIEAALQRRVGMEESSRERLNVFLSTQPDWYAFCPKCMQRLTGTPAQLKEHRCGPEA